MPELKTTVQAVIVAVTERTTKNGNVLHEIHTPDQTKWVTFRPQVANVAKALQGREAIMQCTIEQNGQYTNYYVNEIASVESGALVKPNEVPNTAFNGEQTASAFNPPTAPPAPDVSFKEFAAHAQGEEARRNESIYRQVAAKVAATVSEDPVEFWSNVGDILHFFRTGAPPASFRAAQAVLGLAKTPDVPAQAQQVSYEPETHEPVYAHTDDDIPF